MSRFGPRIAALERGVERELATIDPETADSTTAKRLLRETAGPAIWLYVEGRTGGRQVPFSAAEVQVLEASMNDAFECYAACYDVDIEAAFPIRSAAQLLLETRNIHDVGQLLTGVPERR